MSFVEWSKANVDYGRKLVSSAVEGARIGEFEVLQEEQRFPYLRESARQALRPAIAGACVGALAEYVGNRRSPVRALAAGLVGGVIGFGLGVLWESRELTASVAAHAWKSINKTRDEHWFEKNPIDYA